MLLLDARMTKLAEEAAEILATNFFVAVSDRRNK